MCLCFYSMLVLLFVWFSMCVSMNSRLDSWFMYCCGVLLSVLLCLSVMIECFVWWYMVWQMCVSDVVCELVGRMNFFSGGSVVLQLVSYWLSWVRCVLLSIVWLGMYSLLLRLNRLCWIVMSVVWMLFGSVLVSSMLRFEFSLLMLLIVVICVLFLLMCCLLLRLVVLLLFVCVVILFKWLFM